MHGCIYIVNTDLKMKDFTFEHTEDGKVNFKTLSISFNDTPIVPSTGLIVGPEYTRTVLS